MYWFAICVIVRLLLVLLAFHADKKLLRVLSFFAFALAAGFFSIYVGDLRKTGREVGGKEIWWNDLRPIHALFYLVFGVYAYLGKRNTAWKILLADVVFGTFAFLFHYSSRV
jgi:hypothetical protein